MNITLDFSQNKSLQNITDSQPVAVMPAELAKKLLKMYAQSLVNSTNNRIIAEHIKLLSGYAELNNLQGAMEASMLWLAERDLIQNVTNENWDAYAVSIQGEIDRVHLVDRVYTANHH